MDFKDLLKLISPASAARPLPPQEPREDVLGSLFMDLCEERDAEIAALTSAEHVSATQLRKLRECLQPLVGTSFSYLSLPQEVLESLEPSQLGGVVGTLVDGCLPQLSDLQLEKHFDPIHGQGNREKYPDFTHASGLRVELKLLFTETPGLNIQRPREPSGRLRMPVEEIAPACDTMLLAAFQMRPSVEGLFSPTIVDIEVLSMIQCVLARDASLAARGGGWFEGEPRVPSKSGGMNLDTNFGKLKRVPLKQLQAFLRKHGAPHTTTGEWPAPWSLS